MAKNKSKDKGGPADQDETIADKLAESMRDMWLAHAGDFRSMIEDSEKRVARASMYLTLDFAEAEPIVTLGMSASTKWSDKRVIPLEDPAQTTIPIEDAAEGKRKKNPAEAAAEQGN